MRIALSVMVALTFSMSSTRSSAALAGQTVDTCSVGAGTRARAPLVDGMWIDVPEGWREHPRPNTLGPGPTYGFFGPEGTRDQSCGVLWMAYSGGANPDQVASEFLARPKADPSFSRLTDNRVGVIEQAMATVEGRSRSDGSWQNKVLAHSVTSFATRDGSRADIVAFQAGSTVYLLVSRAPASARQVQERFVEMLASMSPWSHRNPVKKVPPGALTLDGRWTTQGAAIVITAKGRDQYRFEETYIRNLRDEVFRGQGTLTILSPGRLLRKKLGETAKECPFQLERNDATERDTLTFCDDRYESRWP